jgi:hypothetical protein
LGLVRRLRIHHADLDGNEAFSSRIVAQLYRKSWIRIRGSAAAFRNA